MKKSVLRIAAVVLFALVVFINISHRSVKAFQGNKDSEAAAATNAIEGEGVLEVADSAEEELYSEPTIENIDKFGAGAGIDHKVEIADHIEIASAEEKESIAMVPDSVDDGENPAVSDESSDLSPEAIETEENEKSTEVLAGRSEPKTAGRDLPIVMLAVFALLADFFLVLIENASGMSETDKALAIRRIKGHVRQGDRISHIFASFEVFMLLLYYHLIGKYIKQKKNYA